MLRTTGLLDNSRSRYELQITRTQQARVTPALLSPVSVDVFDVVDGRLTMASLHTMTRELEPCLEIIPHSEMSRYFKVL